MNPMWSCVDGIWETTILNKVVQVSHEEIHSKGGQHVNGSPGVKWRIGTGEWRKSHCRSMHETMQKLPSFIYDLNLFGYFD